MNRLELEIGDVQMPQDNGRISLDNENLCVLVNDLQELIDNFYTEIDNIGSKTLPWFKERPILSPTNDQVGKVNNVILLKIDAPTQTYYSVDTVLYLQEEVPWSPLDCPHIESKEF